MMNCVIACKNRGASGSKSESDQAGSGYPQRCCSIRLDLNDSALASQRSSHVKIPVTIERQALRSAETAIESRNRTVRVNLIDGIEATVGWAGDEQISLRPECQVVRRNAGLQCCENKNLPV